MPAQEKKGLDATLEGEIGAILEEIGIIVKEADTLLAAETAGNMTDKKFTVCVRCGKPRIHSNTVEETIGTSQVVTIESICPDPDCQEKVHKMLKDESDRRKISAANRASRPARVRNDIRLSKTA